MRRFDAELRKADRRAAWQEVAPILLMFGSLMAVYAVVFAVFLLLPPQGLALVVFFVIVWVAMVWP
jgi:fatty acid desaturase